MDKQPCKHLKGLLILILAIPLSQHTNSCKEILITFLQIQLQQVVQFFNLRLKTNNLRLTSTLLTRPRMPILYLIKRNSPFLCVSRLNKRIPF